LKINHLATLPWAVFIHPQTFPDCQSLFFINEFWIEPCAKRQEIQHLPGPIFRAFFPRNFKAIFLKKLCEKQIFRGKKKSCEVFTPGEKKLSVFFGTLISVWFGFDSPLPRISKG
jgi:hypothetical protein